MEIRPFNKQDIPELLSMMKKLAVFEGYIDDFCVTEQDLIEFGLTTEPLFKSLVAVDYNIIQGYLVYYSIPYTYDLKPKIILKELYVDKKYRGNSVGTLLFDALKTVAYEQDAGIIEWLVLPHNDKAKKFYKRQGGKPIINWQPWHIKF